MPIEIESPEELGYDTIDANLAESSFRDQRLSDLGVDIEVDDLLLAYGDHLGDPDLRRAIADQAGVDPDEVIVTPGAAAALVLIATSLLEARDRLLPPIREQIAVHRAVVREWIAGDDRFAWVEPSGGVVAFPWLRPEVGVDVERFYAELNGDLGTYVGPGHWFEQDRRHFRLGFGWPTTEELRRGLAALSEAATRALS